jgi:DNA polymerase epsilon subunit 1
MIALLFNLIYFI